MPNLIHTVGAAIRNYIAHIHQDYRRMWKNYLLQSLLAVAAVFAVFWVLARENAIILASIGATAFIVFTIPKYPTAQPRRVIGGHALGLLTGSLVTLIPHSGESPTIMVYALAVGASMFLMVALDMEHPPACATALGVAMAGFSARVAIAVFTSAIALSIVQRLLRKYLQDLT